MEMRDDRLPLPSEDGGDLVEEPNAGMTDDPLVATEEGVPYDPPTERVIAQTGEPGGPDVASTHPDAGEELDRVDTVQQPNASPPRDDELTADVLEALRASDVPAGDRIRILAEGSRVLVRGEVESLEVLDEILGLIDDVPGVDEVIDDVDVAGV